MKTKIRLLAMLLIVCSVMSLTSCYLSDLGFELPMLSGEGNGNGSSQSNGDTYINVEGGDNLDITINSSSSENILAAAKSLLSTVSVYCEFEKTASGFGGVAGQTQKYSSAGSGVIYWLDKKAGDAIIVTNHHVVYDLNANTKNHISDKIQIFLYGQQLSQYAIDAEYVGGSMNYDLAVLKVEKNTVLMESGAIAADIADSNSVSVLESAIAIGNPEGSGISATVGHVNVESEYIQMMGADNQTYVEYRVMRVDAAVNSGNSGGGLFNSRGELIGIVNAKMSSSSVDNIGYAIPSNVVKGVVENIRYYCEGKEADTLKRCIMGITVSANSSKAEYDTATGKIRIVEEVMISDITATSSVKSYLKKNDVINSINIDGVKHEVIRIYNVVDAMLNARVGSSVVLNVTRNGEQLDITVPIVESMLTEYK